jgi:uncharacterized protein (DUF2384 family)
VDDEHRCSPGGLDHVSLPEHLHEVRAADQSAGVAEETDEHGAPARILEIEARTLERRQNERRSLSADEGRRSTTHCPDASVT